MRTEIVGRDEELAQIDAFLTGDDSRALMLEGETGIGKTTLWRRGLECAEARGLRILTCSAVSSETQLGFTGLRDLLAQAFDETASQLPGPQRRALDVALLREEPDGPPPDRGAVGAAFLSTLRELAERGPVLLAIDDVRWLDPPTALVLAYAVRRLRDEQVQLFLTTRSEERAQVPEQLDRALEGLHRLRIGPLSLGALNHLFPSSLDAAFPRPTLVGLWEASGGNPFFALEIARAVEASGGRLVPGQPLPVPGSLHELVQARLAGLSEVAGDVLLAAAALARPTVELVCAGPPDAGEQFEQAIAASVLQVDEGRVRFVHPLLAAAVYSAAAPAKRREVHRYLAGLVEDSEERARHLALASDRPASDVADLLEASARLARARGAPSAAAELAEEAVRLTPSDQPAEMIRRTIAAGGYHFEAGDPDRARRLFGAAAQAAGPGPGRAQALWRLARTHVFEADHRTAEGLYREALVHAGGDVETKIEAEAGLAVAMMRMLDDLPTAARHARAAVELAEAHTLRNALPELIARLALIDGLLGDPDALELATSAVELETTARARGESEGEYFARTLGGASFMLGVLLQWADRLEESRISFESARGRILELGDESSLPLLGRYLASNSWLEGDWESAAREAEEAYEIAAQTGQTSQQGVLAGVRGLVLAHLGRIDDARAMAEEASIVSRETGAMFGSLLASSALGLLELSLGNPVETDRHLAPLLARLEEAGVREPGAMRFVADEIEALILLDRLDEAETQAVRLERRALELDRPSALAATYRCRGLLAAARGDLDGGLASVQSALTQHDRVSMPFERARTLLALGSLERRSKRKRAARDSLQQALALFESLGAPLWADKARAELARVGGRTPAGDVLTPTERRVAELVAEGRSNKEVAAALFVTVKAVEANLSRIYAKLGIHSRTELARLLASGNKPDNL